MDVDYYYIVRLAESLLCCKWIIPLVEGNGGLGGREERGAYACWVEGNALSC